MRLTWRDAVATLATAALTTLYIAQEVEASWAPITSTRWLAVAVLGLGVLACATGAGTMSEAPPAGGPGAWLGPIAGFALIGAILFGWSLLVGIAVAASVLLWMITTTRHLVAGPPPLHEDQPELTHTGSRS